MKKKLLALSLVAAMALSLVACGGGKSSSYKLGMGVVLSDGTSDGSAQVNGTYAAVLLDSEGKIVKCAVDCAQTTVSTTDGELQNEAEVDFRTKVQKGDDYNMVTYGGAIAEWYQQAQAFADYCVGKTASEVSAIETVTNDEGHQVATDEKLLAGCTISIADMQEAVVKACNDEYAKTVSGSNVKLGISAASSYNSSNASYSEDADGVCGIDTYYAAVAVDESGKLLAALLDGSQPKVGFDATGAETSFSFNGTKKELKDNYGMVAYGSAIAEWYEQATSLENYIVGKTSSEVAAVAVDGEGHATDDALLSSCTIHVTPYLPIFVEAMNNAQ